MIEKMPFQQEKIPSTVIDKLIGLEMNRESVTCLVSNLQGIYDRPNRYYHNFKHIIQVANFIDENLDNIDNPRVALWAALYHDAVYDTSNQLGENEDESAKLAELELAGKLTEEEVEQVCSYIKSTASHNADTENHDLSLFLDADMSILGLAPKAYSDYAANIRKEYGWVPDEQYINARTKVLQGFLSRNRIFITDLAYNMFESQARINIQTELERLSEQ